MTMRRHVHMVSAAMKTFRSSSVHFGRNERLKSTTSDLNRDIDTRYVNEKTYSLTTSSSHHQQSVRKNTTFWAGFRAAAYFQVRNL